MNNTFLLGEKTAMTEQTKSNHLYGKTLSPCAAAVGGKSKASPSKFSWGGKGVQSNSNQFKQLHDNFPKKHLLRSTVIDAKVYTDTRSKGLTARLVKYYGDNNRNDDNNVSEINSLSVEKRLGSQIYKKVGDFPIVHLKKPHLITNNLRRSSSLSSLKVLPSPSQHQSRYSQLNARSQILRSGSVVSLQDQYQHSSTANFNTTLKSPPMGISTNVQHTNNNNNSHHHNHSMNTLTHRDCNEKLYLRDNQPLQSLHTEYEAHPTPSVLDALKEISRKRINCDDLDGDQVKKAKGEIARKSSYYINSQLQNHQSTGALTLTTTTTTTTTSTPSMFSKRQRDDNNISPNSNSLILQALKKRVCPTTTNDILSSLSSSTNLYKSKRKLDSQLVGEQLVKKSNSEIIQTSKYTHHNESLDSENTLTIPSSSSTTIIQQLESQKSQNLINKFPINTMSSSSSILVTTPISSTGTLNALQPNTNNYSTQKQPTITLFNKIYHKDNKILTNNNKNIHDNNNNNNNKDGDDDFDDDEDINGGIAFIKVKHPDLSMKTHQQSKRFNNEKDNEKSKLTLMLSCLQKELDGNEDDDDDEFDGIIDVSTSQVNTDNMIQTNVTKSNPSISSSSSLITSTNNQITTTTSIDTQKTPSHMISSIAPSTMGNNSITNNNTTSLSCTAKNATDSSPLTFGISPLQKFDQSIVTSEPAIVKPVLIQPITTSSEQRIGGFCFAATSSTPTVSYQTTSITPINSLANNSTASPTNVQSLNQNTFMNNTSISQTSSPISSLSVPSIIPTSKFIDFSQIKMPTVATSTNIPSTTNISSSIMGFSSTNDTMQTPTTTTTTTTANTIMPSTSLSFSSPNMNFAFGTTAPPPTTTTIPSNHPSNQMFTNVKTMAESSTTSNPSAATNDSIFKFNGNESTLKQQQPQPQQQQQQSQQIQFGIQSTQSPIFSTVTPIQSNTTADAQLNVFGKSSTTANEFPSTGSFQYGSGGGGGNTTTPQNTIQSIQSNAVKNLFDVPKFNSMPSSNAFAFNGNTGTTDQNNKMSSNNFLQSSSSSSASVSGGNNNNNNPSAINMFGNITNNNNNLQNSSLQTKPINVFGGGGGGGGDATTTTTGNVKNNPTHLNIGQQTSDQNKSSLFFDSTNTFGSPKSIQSSTTGGANQQLFVFGGGGNNNTTHNNNNNNNTNNNSLQNQQTFGSNSTGGNVIINKPTASAAPFSFTAGTAISPIAAASSSSSTTISLQNSSFTPVSPPLFGGGIGGGGASTLNVPSAAPNASTSSNAPFIFGGIGGNSNSTADNGTLPSFSVIANNNNNNFNNNNNTFGSSTTQNTNNNGFNFTRNSNENNNNGGNQMMQQNNQSSNNQNTNSSNSIFNFTASNSIQNPSSSSSSFSGGGAGGLGSNAPNALQSTTSQQINTATVGPFTFGGNNNNNSNNNNNNNTGGNGDNQPGFSFNLNSSTNPSLGNNPFTFTATNNNNNNNNNSTPNLFNAVPSQTTSSPATSYVRSKNYRAPSRKYR